MARACYVQMYAAYETRCYDVCRVLASIDYDTRPHDEKKDFWEPHPTAYTQKLNANIKPYAQSFKPYALNLKP